MTGSVTQKDAQFLFTIQQEIINIAGNLQVGFKNNRGPQIRKIDNTGQNSPLKLRRQTQFFFHDLVLAGQFEFDATPCIDFTFQCLHIETLTVGAPFFGFTASLFPHYLSHV